MSLPVATALGHADRIWPAVLVSLAVHAGLVVVAVVRRPPAIDLDQKPIVAKLVRLGEKRPEEWLPRKEAPPPPAPEAPPAPAPSPAVVTAKPAPTVTKQTPPPAVKPAGGSPLASVMSKMQKEVARERWGDPNGDPAGDSSEGSEGDRYLALVHGALQSAYRLPSTISERERMFLKATVVLYVEPDGKVTNWRFESRSGNDAYDGALERAIRQVRLPPPPAELRERFRRGGVGVNFHL